MEEKGFCEAFVKIVELTGMLKTSNSRKFNGLSYYRIDRHWEIAINGTWKEIDKIPPSHCLVKYNGWVAGVISPYGGEIAYGDEANEDTFIEAIDTVLSEKKKAKK